MQSVIDADLSFWYKKFWMIQSLEVFNVISGADNPAVFIMFPVPIIYMADDPINLSYYKFY